MKENGHACCLFLFLRKQGEINSTRSILHQPTLPFLELAGYDRKVQEKMCAPARSELSGTHT